MSKVLFASLALCGSLLATQALAAHHKHAGHAATPKAAAAAASLPADAVASAPVPDTRANRALYRPLSRAGRLTAAKGN
jgi:hypothetical protein